ncbi:MULTISPECIES: RcnB family protein [Erwinia]|uniref:RcnB family protein n=1 Tax=Erwinia TaxID=551 RepID=UPI00105F7865|nr:RcnB family protein [Erwinia aphidicola]MCP2232430.1 Ni/Co efflux regulator RcnB [Erwinia aphidicola]
MKKSRTIALSAMIFSSLSLSAFAQGPDEGPGQQPLKHPQQNQPHQPHQQNQGGMPQRGAEHQANNHPQQRQPDFRRGRPLPQQYRGEGYQVNDWHKRGLKAPPSGHRWVNVKGNYVLIAVATGVIASVIAHH